MSGRGTDNRLEDHSRPRAVERKESRRIRRDGPDEIEGDEVVEPSSSAERDVAPSASAERDTVEQDR
jgi:hypothetical protein